MDLSKFENKMVEVLSYDNNVYRGKVGDYIEAEEDDEGREMIVVDDIIRKTPIGFFMEDIKSIKII